VVRTPILVALAFCAGVYTTSLAQSAPKPLPPYPAAVHTLQGDIRIEWVDSIFTCGTVKTAIGCTTYDTRRIQITRGMDTHLTWVTIEHEKYHMKFHDRHIVFTSIENEDEVCDRLAEARVLEMEQGLP
jgi:hypothetical protein